jgi:FtsH-binding integral membrane protein
MADLNYRTGVRTGAGVRAGIDEGLRAYMVRVYNMMALGVAVTALVTLFMANNPALMATVAMGPMKWVLFVGVLGLGFFAPRLIFSGNSAMAHAAYWTYAVLWGLLISPMIYAYMNIDGGSLIFRALAITAATFGATSLAGYVTKRDLSGFGGFFMMASIGLIIAIVVNAIFIQSVGFSLITSIVVVLLFSAITAWETQMIKSMYVEGDAAGIAQGKAIFGAFMLYGSFITIFIHILNILGIMRSE